MTFGEGFKALADLSYMGGVLFIVIAGRPLLGALRDLATVGRMLVESRSEEAREAKAERAQIIEGQKAIRADLADVKATVVARL